LKGYELKK